MEPVSREPLDAGGALELLRRRVLLIAVSALVAAGIAMVFSVTQEKQYAATASLLFRDPGLDQRLFGATGSVATPDPTRQAATNLQLVSIDAVADRTARTLGQGLTGKQVSDKVSVSERGQADLASVTATDPDPERAAALANAYTESYIVFRRRADRAKVARARRQIELQLERLSPAERNAQEDQSLQTQLSNLRTLEALQTGNAEVVQKADVPSSPVSPKVGQTTFLGGILGLFLGLGLALVFARLDRRLMGPEELEESLSAPVLGAVPDSKGLSANNGYLPPQLPPPEAEAFKMLHTRLRYVDFGRKIRSVLVTSADAAVGKSTIAWHLASTAASAGVKTILLECDFHQPSFAASHGLKPLPGLSELLTHQTDDVVQHILVDTGVDGNLRARHFDVITSGGKPSNPVELMESPESLKLIEQLSKRYELVVIDTPPVTQIPDAIPLMKLVTGVIVVGELGRTTREAAAAVRDQLHSLDAPILGVVANRMRKHPGYYDNYGRDRSGIGRRLGIGL